VVGLCENGSEISSEFMGKLRKVILSHNKITEMLRVLYHGIFQKEL
jgi:hypothetical protein